MESGYHANLCERLEEEYTCCICHEAYRRPVQLGCGHRFCKGCLDNHQRCQEERGTAFTCPVDRDIIDLNEVFPDRAIERYVLSLAVKCNNMAQCNWTGELRGLEGHMQQCPFNCLICEYCNRDYLLKDKQDHINGCDRWPLKCVNCFAIIPRQEMTLHLETCPLAIFHCKFQQVGCTYTGTNTELKIHLSSEIESHLNIAILKMYTQNEDLERKVETNVKKNEDLETKLGAAVAEIEHLEKKEETNVKKNEYLETTMGAAVAEIEDLKRKVETNVKKNEDLETKLGAAVAEIEHLERKVETNVKKNKNLEQKLQKAGEEIKHLDKELKTSWQKAENLEPKFEASVENCSGLEKRFEKFVIETAPSPLIGKAMYEAIQLGYNSVFFPIDYAGLNLNKPYELFSSAPFYTQLGGYQLKLGAEVRSNGVFLYFCVMHSAKEATLQWPSSIKYTIYLLHPFEEDKHGMKSFDSQQQQRVPGALDCKEQFHIDTFDHSYINGGGYLMKDTVYVMCKIDL